MKEIHKEHIPEASFNDASPDDNNFLEDIQKLYIK